MLDAPKTWSQSPVFWGAVVSLMILGAAVILALSPACHTSAGGFVSCPTKFFYLKQATPNEVGDTLAGFAGALAFVWIIVTVAVQSQELKAQREELELTRNELASMAEAQKEQVKVLQAQADIFEDEKTARDELRFEKLLQQHLNSIVVALQDCGFEFHNTGSVSSLDRTWVSISGASKPGIDEDQYIRQMSFDTNTTYWKAVSFLKKHQIEKRPTNREKFKLAWDRIAEVESISNDIPIDQVVRVNAMRLMALKENLGRLLALDIWKEPRKSNYVEPTLGDMQ